MFFYGLLTATTAIVAAEIAFNYSLGDVVKDLAIRLFRGAEAKAKAQLERAEARLLKLKNKGLALIK